MATSQVEIFPGSCRILGGEVICFLGMGEVSMTDNAIETTELRLNDLLRVSHHSGVSYWQLLKMLVSAWVDIFIMAQTADHVKRKD